MTRQNTISALALSPVLFAALALGAQEPASKAAVKDERIDDAKAAPAIACTLTSKEKRDRVEEVETRLFDDVLRIEELESGYTLWFAAESGRLQHLAEFVELESQCCAFLDFEIRLEAGAREVALSLTGPEGTKEVLSSLLAD